MCVPTHLGPVSAAHSTGRASSPRLGTALPVTCPRCPGVKPGNTPARSLPEPSRKQTQESKAWWQTRDRHPVQPALRAFLCCAWNRVRASKHLCAHPREDPQAGVQADSSTQVRECGHVQAQLPSRVLYGSARAGGHAQAQSHQLLGTSTI
jgi:hypothetical protein